jgi:acetyl esterase/lipase
MGSYDSWARLAAASGVAAITYANREPVEDASAVIDFVRDNGAAVGIDATRIGVWSCSGNAPTALSLLMRKSEPPLRCGILLYGFLLDSEGSTAVADAARQFRFANPTAEKSADDLPEDLPLLLVRAGRDENPGLNPSIDRFTARALARNLPVTVVNHATGLHAFDLMDDGESTREIIRQTLAFMRFHLLGSAAAEDPSRRVPSPAERGEA